MYERQTNHTWIKGVHAVHTVMLQSQVSSIRGTNLEQNERQDLARGSKERHGLVF
jgi:hypothetical protein